MRVRSPASAGSLLALAVTIALAAVTAALVTPSLAMAAGAVGGDRGGPPDAPPSARLSVFRMDVSHYPAIGLVITVPGVRGPLRNRDTVVISGATAVHPAVHQLSPADVELVLAPDTGLQPAAMRAEQGAATLFLASLPGGTQTAAVNPSRLGVLAHGLTRDPAVSVAEVATLTRTRSTTAARLATALSAFSRGSTVRRTVVLVVSGGRALGAKAEARFRQRLVASGTALYVLDATASGSTAYDSLATESGGLALRVRAPGSWSSAFSHVTSDLAGQYYLRFADTMPLPGAVTILVRTSAGIKSAPAYLPVVNPIAPPLPAPAKAASRPADWDRPLTVLAALLIILGISYGLGMLVASRRDLPGRVAQRKLAQGALPGSLTHDGLFFVFLMPCLNEEKVIVNSLQRLLAIPGNDFVVLVVDDGSDDNTAAVVSGVRSDRVWLLSRKLPQARQGKGEALNAAVHYLVGSGHLAGRDPDRVIVVVVDADGRLDLHAIEQVRPYFMDPAIGAVQIGVRINNRQQSWLARMQDMEFVIYTEVFQRGRRHLGSVGLGGNGQFMRLSAMLSLGPEPWTRSLTDDLDLGVRLIAAGWRNEYCSAVAVHQQGVVELRRLIRQRSRWFQGHLQSWKLIPLVLRSAPSRARADLLYHLSSPAVLLIASLLTTSFLLSVVNSALLAVHGRDPAGLWIASTYLLTFGPALIFSSVYWTRERGRGVGPVRLFCFAHLYVCYGMMWYASGWWAVGRTLRGRTGWAKTERVSETPVAPPVTVGANQQAAVVLAGGGNAPRTSLRPAVPIPAVLAAGRTSRGPRRRLTAAAATAALASLLCAAVVADSVSSGGRAPWVPVFSGYGTTSLTGSGAAVTVTLEPARTQARQVTHSALIVSAPWYADFVATLHVRTIRQLRRGAAGSPHEWEVGWVIWHYTSHNRFYALTLEPTGWVLSKQDPTYRGGERFLASGVTPRFRIGVPHTVGIIQVGNQITVAADGHLLTRFTDQQRPYLSGAFGFYSEDSQADFDHILLDQLPAQST